MIQLCLSYEIKPKPVIITKLEKLNDKNVKHVSHLILQISFLTLFDVRYKPYILFEG